jgi:hypothetical protein
LGKKQEKAMSSLVLLIFGLIFFGFSWINYVTAFDKFDQMRLDSLKPDIDSCRKAVKSGREALREAAIGVPQRHHQQRITKLQKVFKSHSRKIQKGEELKLNILDKIPSQYDCVPISSTMFPPPTTPIPKVAKTKSEKIISKDIKIEARPLLLDSQNDPFKKVIEFYNGFLDEDEFCNGPRPSSLADLTDGQLGGYVASLMTTHATFLCPFCHQFATHFHQKLLNPRKHGMADDEKFLFNSALAHFPDPQTICSAALPVCHNNYAVVSRNMTSATKCLECSLCSTLTITLLQKVILNQHVIDHIKRSADEEIFTNICSEICRLNTTAETGFDNKNQTLCRKFLSNQLDWILDVLKQYLLPSGFCSKVFLCKFHF